MRLLCSISIVLFVMRLIFVLLSEMMLVLMLVVIVRSGRLSEAAALVSCELFMCTSILSVCV